MAEDIQIVEFNTNESGKKENTFVYVYNLSKKPDSEWLQIFIHEFPALVQHRDYRLDRVVYGVTIIIKEDRLSIRDIGVDYLEDAVIKLNKIMEVINKKYDDKKSEQDKQKEAEKETINSVNERMKALFKK